MENNSASLLVMTLGKALDRIASILSGWTGNNRWQLDSKTEKDSLLSFGRGILINQRSTTKYVFSYLQIINNSEAINGNILIRTTCNLMHFIIMCVRLSSIVMMSCMLVCHVFVKSLL